MILTGILTGRARVVVFAAASAAMLAFASNAGAQDVPESHLKAARAAVSAFRATDLYDRILPQAAAALKQELIQKNPDQAKLITDTVDAQALTLAARRSDLEREAALAYAKVFSEAELNAIAAFYNSEAGKKLLEDGPIVTREVDKAADIWSRGIGRDLATNVAQELAKTTGAPQNTDAAPAPGAATPVTPPAAGTPSK
jgi:hypothetical protein